MSGFQQVVRTTSRTSEEIAQEKINDHRAEAVSFFAQAASIPGGNRAHGYQIMLEKLFNIIESEHDVEALVGTVLDALAPIVRRHPDQTAVSERFKTFIQDINTSQ